MMVGALIPEGLLVSSAGILPAVAGHLARAGGGGTAALRFRDLSEWRMV
jgi:hypothetical protein